ncbi:HNH endonuclease signature motif containing protein [uncultured Alistipes sp.]|uniref:HNH endonuclease n=1 Tax=uncultured Alistipes sp. TaxID=538949 RepID=UPI0025DBA4F2|nr:HNH endonuclease signature motif containing protein [uncultured Alistipes sp.]
MNKELENRLLILYAILQLGGISNKKDVLDFLENQGLIILGDKDKTILKSRREIKWRNELAYVRYHLVELLALYQEEWAITMPGKKYYNLLVDILKSCSQDYIFQRIRKPSVFDYIKSFDRAYKVKEDIQGASSASEYEALVKCRKGQGRFRTDLMEVCEGKCRVTGYSDKALLVASHIKPWRLCSSKKEKLDKFNGLLLLPNLDKLFDSNLITFDSSDGHLVISDWVRDKELLGIDESMKIEVFDENRKYLEYHNRMLFKDRNKYYPKGK